MTVTVGQRFRKTRRASWTTPDAKGVEVITAICVVTYADARRLEYKVETVESSENLLPTLNGQSGWTGGGISLDALDRMGVQFI